jgi:shikimate kinase
MKTRSNIVLIGMPGVGKSTLGEKLAQKLGRRFIDVDTVIEQRTGLKLQDIIDRFGDEKFVEIEEEALLSLGECENCLISPGGSAVYSAKAMNVLKRNARVVFLEASLELIRQNITDRETRGIVGLKGRGLKSLFEERAALYRKFADITVAVPADYDIALIIDLILQELSGKPE